MNHGSDELEFAIDNIDGQKSQIREQMLARLKALDPAARCRDSASMLKTLRDSELWRHAGTVLIYHPLKSEPDVAPLLDDADRRILLPRVTRGGLDLHLYGGADSLQRSAYGLLEPDPATSPSITVAAIDLAIIPGLAFDPTTGVRLGRGGGYYDRLLADDEFEAVTIGIAFELQMREDLPCEPHDQAVDHVLTELSLRRRM